MTNVAIEAKAVTYQYPLSGRAALNHLDLKVSRGEFILIMGPTGSGKSTLGLCLNGLIPHVVGGELEGHVIIDGLDSRSVSVAQLATRVGLLFQDPDAQICNLYGSDELAFGCENLGLPRDEILARVAWAANVLELNEILSVPTQHLSLGQKQRVALASILAMKPRILILDEPTSNLDGTTVRNLADTLRELRDSEGMTVVVIDHDADGFVDLVDRLVLMQEGKIVAEGTPDELFVDRDHKMIDSGVKLPELSLLMAELQKIESREAYHGQLTVKDVSAYIANHYRSIAPHLPMRSIESSKVATPASVVSVENVSVELPNGRLLLNDVSMSVAPNETIGLVGANGAGKTTLCRLISGLRRPSRGTVRICGDDIRKMKTEWIARKIGFVFQEPDHQFIKERAGEDIEYSWRSLIGDTDELQQQVSRSLSIFGLSDYREAYVYRMSLGQRRLLSIATVLVPGKKVLILDEPSTGLDARSTHNLIAALREARRDGLGTILITHDVNLLSLLCDTIYALADGKLVYEGDMHGLMRKPEIMRQVSIQPPRVWQISEELTCHYAMDIEPSFTLPDLVIQLQARDE